MLKRFALRLVNGRFAEVTFVAKRGLKREKPIDHSLADELPVYEYPAKKSTDNSIYVWGLGEHGALGYYLQKRKLMSRRTDERFRTYVRPLRLVFGELNNVIHVAAGFGFSAFAVKSKTETKVFGTGLNSDSQIGFHEPRRNAPLGMLISPAPITIHFRQPEITTVTGMSAGRAHLAVCTDLEGVFMLGNNAYGQCGRRINENEEYRGSRVVHNIKSLDDGRIVNVECGQDHTLFLTENGAVYSCGWGADGQTGLGHTGNEGRPQQVLGDIKGEKIVKISSKSDCVLAINDKGDVFGWGNSEYCQIFEEEEGLQQVNVPVHLKKCQGFGKIIDVAAAGSYCMMLNEAGEVFTWGYGILGRGPQVTLSWKPELIPPIIFGKNQFSGDVRVTSIYCGLNHSAAINSKGDLFTWGKNKGGCLGLGNKNDQFFPLRVSLSAMCKKLSLGADHTLAVCRQF